MAKKRKKKDLITVLNPQGTFRGPLSIKAAITLILQGVAFPSTEHPMAVFLISRFKQPYRFTPADPRVNYDRAVASGLASRLDMKHIPIIAPDEMLINHTTRSIRIMHADSGALGRGVDLCTARAA